tara:strand:+ start:189 stop:458 length:270 start_codon:yes stop_codon:yes gene_type:complete
MRTIYKYKLDITYEQHLKIIGFESFLKVGVQGDTLFLWCMVDTDNKSLYHYDVKIYGTGNPINDKGMTKDTYLGTGLMPSGLVWHVFAN